MDLVKGVDCPLIEAQGYVARVADVGCVSFLLYDRVKIDGILQRKAVQEVVIPYSLSRLYDQQRAFWRKLGMQPRNDVPKRLLYVDGVGVVEVIQPLPSGYSKFANLIDPAQAGLH